MRFLVLFITILLCSTTIKAQRLYSESGDFYEKSKRNVVDHAKLGVFYELKFRKDSTKLNDYTEAQTVLMKSSKYSSLNIDIVFIDCLMSGIAFGKLLGILP